MYYTYFKNIGNTIHIKYKEQGNPTTFSKSITDHKPTLFTKSDETTEWSSIYDYPLKPIEFDSIRSAKEFAKQYKDVDNFTIEGNSNYANQFIIELFDGQQPQYEAHNINKGILDIEVFAPEFPKPEEAKWPMSSFTLYNSVENVFYSVLLHNGDDNQTWSKSKSDDEVKQLNINFKMVHSERELLTLLLTYIKEHKYDLVSGWHSEGFDIPYIINRCNQILGHKFTREMLSPFNKIDSRMVRVGFGKEREKFEIVGLPHLDYLELYKKHTYTPRESYKLDFIAEAELGKRKLEYEGSLEDLYMKDLQLYMDYNIIDVNLIKELDEKLGLFDLVFALTYYGMSNYEDTLGTVKFWEQLIAKFLYTQNKAPLFNRKQQQSRDFEGAYVKEPKKGFHDWVVSFDLNSLYPHIIQQLNIGVETLVKNVPDALKAIKPKSSFNKLLNKETDLSVLQDYDVTMSPTFTFYKKDKMSFLSHLMRELYSQRKEFKKKMLDAEQKKVDAVKGSDEYKHWESVEAAMNNMQLGMKICLNSCYGSLGQKSFLYYEVDNAESITMFGQLINRWTCEDINRYLGGLFGNESKQYWIYSDTDSGYFTLDDFVNTLPVSYTQAQTVQAVDDFCNQIIAPRIEEKCQELCDYMNQYEQRMFWSREAISDRAAWVGKKKYVMSVLNNEGVNFIGKDKFKIMGMESVKSSTPAWARKLLADMYKSAIRTDQSTTHKLIESARAHFDSLDTASIAIPRGVNDIGKYIDETGNPGKGCPKHVRAAIVHNNFLTDYNIKSIEPIADGTKLKYVELKMPNPLRSPVVGFEGKPPKEMDIDRYVDRDTIFESSFEKPAQIFLSAVDWTLVETNTLF